VSDALPADYGVNACGPRARAGMTREQREVHARLASLPKRVHSKTERDEMARQLRAADLSDSLSRARKNGARVEAAVRASKTRAGVTVSHRDLILAALQTGPKTLAELTDITKGAKASSRVSELRKLGWDIVIELEGNYGRRYTLRGRA
jgi:hypothetical protein